MQAMRETLGMTRLTLAAELGVSEQMIWLYESGRRPLTRKRRAQLAQLASREQVVLYDKAPCPTCQGTGWVPTQGHGLPLEPDPEPLRELARPEPPAAPEPEPVPPAILARGPGRRPH